MFSDVETATPASSLVQALDRSTTDARRRHAARLTRFLDAARSLSNATGSADFTVANVVAEAGLSLKSFYALFRGKDDLLCALLEEDSARGALLVQREIDHEVLPLRRIEAYVRTIIALAVLPGSRGYAAVLLREQHRLSEARPAELRAALHPIRSPLVNELATAIECRAVSYEDVEALTEIVFTTVIGAIGRALAADPDAIEDVIEHTWRFLRGGLTTDGDERAAR